MTKEDGLTGTTGSEADATGGATSAVAECPVDLATVERIFGAAMQDAEVQQRDNGVDCTFLREDQIGSVVLSTIEDAKAGFLGIAATLPDAEPVSGLGDEALFSWGRSTLLVRSQDKLLQIQLITMLEISPERTCAARS